MAAEDRILKILLQLRADTADSAKVTGALKEVEAQATKTAVAVSRVTTGRAGQKITDTSIATAQQDTAAAAAMRAQLDAQYKARLAVQGAAGQTLAIDEKSVITAELRGAAEARRVLQMERQVVMEIQLEAAEARIAGNPAMAAKLEREAAIRLQALTIQRATNVSMEVAIAQAERLAIAQDIGNVKAAAGINVTRGMATSLAQQLATGRVSAESISRSFSGFGTSLSIAAVAGFGLYQFIDGLDDEAIAFNEEMGKTSGRLDEQIAKWRELSRDAKDAKDIRGLTTAILPELNQLSQRLEEIRRKEITGWKFVFEQVIGFQLRAFGYDITGPFTRQQEEMERRQKIINDAAILRARAEILLAKDAAAAWEQVKILPAAEAIAIYTSKIEELRGKQEALDLTTQQGIEQYDELGREIGEAEEKRRILQDRTRDATQFEIERLRELRQEQSLINDNPLLTANEKQAALHNLYLKERTVLLGGIVKLEALIADLIKTGASEEDEHLKNLRKSYADLNFEVAKLDVKISATSGSFTGQFGAEMIKWVDGMGTAAEQAANLITGTLDNAISQVSRNIAQAIWRTGELEDIWISLGETATQQMIEMGLQMGVQFIAAEARKVAGTQSTVTQNAAVTASATPAAVAQSGATGGFNWVAAGIAAAAAIALIVGLMAATGGFAKGGRTGPRRRLATVGEEGEEFVFTADATRNIGIENLYTMMSAAESSSGLSRRGDHLPRFGSGGRIYENDPTYTFGPRGFRGDWDAPVADSGWFRSHGTTFTGGIINPPSFTPPASYSGPVDFPVEPPILPVPRVPGAGHLNWNDIDQALNPNPGFVRELPVNDAPFEWTTSPGDRRFLPSPGGARDTGEFFGPHNEGSGDFAGPFQSRDTGEFFGPPGPGGIVFGGNDIATFGGNLSLGTFLFTPASSLGFGSGRGGYQILIDGKVVTSGNDWINPSDAGRPPEGSITTTDPTVPGSARVISDFAGNLPAGTNYGPGSVFSGFTTPAGMTVVGFDTASGAPVYRDQSGNLYVNPGTGNVVSGFGGMSQADRFSQYSGTGNWTAAQTTRAFLMAGGYPGMPNRMDVGDAGRSLFGTPSKGTGYVDEFGFIVRRPNSYIIGGADGMRIPGAPSRTDSILAHLAPGEQVTEAFETAAIDRMLGGRDWAPRIARFGLDWDRKLDIARPSFASGGRVGPASSSSSASSGRRSGGSQKLNIAIFDDPKKGLRWLQGQEGQKAIIDAVNGARHEIGLPALE